MKKIISVAFLAMLAFLVVGCSKNDEPLQMMWWSDGTEGEVMQSILDEYEEETGVVIELIEVAYDDYESRLSTMIRGEEAPALARVTEGHLNNFKANVLSLEDVYETSNYTNLFFNDEGEAISLPMDITANGMFFNKDLFDKYGVDYPGIGDDVWTWAEFEAEMEKLMDQEDVKNPGVFDNKAHRFFPMVYQFGTKIWETPYTESNLTSDEAVAALETLVRMNTNGTLDPSVWAGSANAANLFRTGAYGFHMSGNWNVSGYQDLPFEWGVVPMPSNGVRSTILGGKSLTAFDGSGQEKAAKEFIEWLAEAENHDKYTGTVPYLTPRLGAEVDYGDFTEYYNVFLDEIAATPAENVADWLNEVMIPGMYPVINRAIEEAAGGIKTPAEAMADLEAELMEMAK